MASRSARLSVAGMCSMTLIERAPSNTVDSGSSPNVQFHDRWPSPALCVIEKSPLVPILSRRPFPMDFRGIDRVDHITPTGEERGEWRDAGPHVDQPAARPQVLLIKPAATGYSQSRGT